MQHKVFNILDFSVASTGGGVNPMPIDNSIFGQMGMGFDGHQWASS